MLWVCRHTYRTTQTDKQTNCMSISRSMNSTYETEVKKRGHLSLVHIVYYCRAVHRVTTTVPTYIQLLIKSLGKSYSS